MRVRPAAREALARIGAPVSLLVCDDVLTTGATAREAQRSLEESGLRVRAVVTVAATRKRYEPGRPAPAGGPRAYPFQGHPSTVCTWRPTGPAISRELGRAVSVRGTIGEAQQPGNRSIRRARMQASTGGLRWM